MTASHGSLQDELGTIDTGMKADLVLLDENPLEDITNTRRIAGVAIKGTYYTQDELRALYSQTKIWTVFSREEGFCLPALEAMTLGAVVVAYDNRGIHETVVDGKNGFIVPVDGRANMLARIEELLADPGLRTRMQAAGWRRARNFSWKRSLDLFEAEALRLIETPPASTAATAAASVAVAGSKLAMEPAV